MDEVLTFEEIKSRFPNEWILIDQPELDGQRRVIRGKVLCHHCDRDKIIDHAKGMSEPLRVAIEFTGKRKPGQILML